MVRVNNRRNEGSGRFLKMQCKDCNKEEMTKNDDDDDKDDDNNDDRDNFWVELGEDESFEIDDFAEADVCQVSEEFSKNENLLKLWRETSFGQVLNFVRSGESRTTKWRKNKIAYSFQKAAKSNHTMTEF